MTTDYSNADKAKKDAKGSPEKSQPVTAPVKKEIKKVVTGDAVVKQKSLGTKFKDVFFGGDFKATMRYVAADVVLPAIRDIIVNTTTEGIKRAVYGENNMRRSGGMMSNYRPKTNYSSISSPFRPDPRGNVFMPDQAPRRVMSARKEMNDVIVASRSDAEHILERMLDCIDQYESVTLADLYAMLGMPSSHVDNKWGWTYIKDAQIQQVQEGYSIRLPDLEEV